jgi:glycosyltransferase involved in cell wall biosynthesis
MLPISVLIPTRNCAPLVPGHIESLRSWMDLAEEIVVVDSESKDGTVELLRQGLGSHPRVKYVNHPPGLYQSWNFGIQNTAAKYIYVATVGDSITRAGITHMYEVAEKFQCEVVISNPIFVDESGAKLPDQKWPVHTILRQMNADRPLLLTTAQQFLFMVTNLWGAILGSSASNLYRGDCLKERPFPTDFGAAGDGAWGVKNIFDVKIALTPEQFSTFRYHEKPYSTSDYYVESLAFKLFRLAQSVVEQQRPRNPALPEILKAVHWDELEPALQTAFVEQEKLERSRHKKMPWYFNPASWRSRAMRNKSEQGIRALTESIIAASRVSPAKPAS